MHTKNRRRPYPATVAEAFAPGYRPGPGSADAQLRAIRDKLALTVAEMSAARFAQAGNLIHEASHAICGALYDGKVKAATANPARATEIADGEFDAELAGIVAFSTAPSRPELMHLAGPVAQARFNAGGRRRPTRREVDRILADDGEHDHAAIIASGATVAEVFAEVDNIVDRCWGAIVELAQRIHTAGEVEHSTVLDVLGGETALSLIRGGARPGTFTVTVPTAV